MASEGIFGRLRRAFRGGGDDGPAAAKQEGDVHALDREDEPRGGVQSEEYRLADPREVVEEGGTVMSAPGGAPQEERSVEERRELSEDMRDRMNRDEPR